MNPAEPPTKAQRGHPRARAIGAGLLAFSLLVLAAGFMYLAPLAADPEAIAQAAGRPPSTGADSVTVSQSRTRVLLEPAAPTTTGLVFIPGGKVDPRAYVPLLRDVAAQGVLVVVLKPPFNTAFFAYGSTEKVLRAHPEIETWAIGGHSLGGVTAALYAADHPVGSPDSVEGLVLWAAFPFTDVRGSGLSVLSISGGNDGLSTPEKTAKSRAQLPAEATFVEVAEANHATFADYGPQRGDGPAPLDRAAAQREITTATASFMKDLG